jgi:glycerol-3-phosphate dehydrogenase (NAD(P)+)
MATANDRVESIARQTNGPFCYHAGMAQGVRVLVVGYGEMGHAMEALLAAHHRVQVWQRRSAIALETAAVAADVVLFCVPTPPHAELAERLRPHLAAHAMCVTVAKGLDDSGRTAIEALASVLAAHPCGVLCGPMIAEDLRARRVGFAELGMRDAQATHRIQELFSPTALHLEPLADVTGLSWCAVLKNVYAMLFGMADELGLGDNMRGYLAVATLAELVRVLTRLGGEPTTAHTLAGLGDLVTTATSRGSHHHELGRRIARAERKGLTGEGLHSLATLTRQARFAWRDLPLFTLTARCALEGADARAAIAQHLSHRFGKIHAPR